MDINSIVAQSYYLTIEAEFNKYLETYATSENFEIKINEEELVAQIEEEWLKKDLNEIGDTTPEKYIKSLVSIEEAVELFVAISKISDVGVPNLLIEKLKGFGEVASDKLFELISVPVELSKPELQMVRCEAVYTIGLIKNEEYKHKLIELLLEATKNKDEIFSEAICSAIVEYQSEVLTDLIDAFEKSENSNTQEYLLTCIAGISREHHTDELFNFLKNAFRILPNKKIAVEVLGDYGDGRAVPFLRGYLVKNTSSMDRSTFNNIVGVIKKLGGEISDLKYEA